MTSIAAQTTTPMHETLCIVGQKIDRDQRIEVYNPCDNSIADTAPRATREDVARALTDAFVQTAGSTVDAVDVILTDVEKSDWAQGGELFSDKALGG